MALLNRAATRRCHGGSERRTARAVHRPGGGRFNAGAVALWRVFAETRSVCRQVWRIVPGALWMIWATPALAQVAKAPEYSLKAAYLFNFTQFIEWPSNRFASAAAPIVIGVIGEDPFGNALDQAVKGKTVRGRPFEVRRFNQPAELGACHVLFVCASEAKRLPDILAAVKKHSVLTVSDLDRFAEQGGIINFYTESNKVRFKINLSAAERAGTKISSQLLRLGTIIRDERDAD